MCYLLKNISTLLLVILKLSIITSGQAFTYKTLGVICSIFNYTKVPIPPEQCTALSAYTSMKDQVDGANRIRGKLPLLLIMDTLDYDNDDSLLKKEPAEVLKDFKQVNFDCMAIDYAYKFTQTKSKTTSEDIGIFLDKTKREFPGKGFGLVLTKSLKEMEKKLDLTVLESRVDFFLLNTTAFRSCTHEHYQDNMEALEIPDDVMKVINHLIVTERPLARMVYSINLKIESVKKFNLFSAEMDFSYLCENKLAENRRYCYNSVQNLFDLARIRILKLMAGVHVIGVDYDDYSGACGCITPNDLKPTFRGLKTIAGASQEAKNNVKYYDCVKGNYPIIK